MVFEMVFNHPPLKTMKSFHLFLKKWGEGIGLITICLGCVVLLFSGGSVDLLYTLSLVPYVLLVFFFIIKHPGKLLLIYLLGLPAYTLSLAIIYRITGSASLITLLQPWKEILAILILIFTITSMVARLRIKRFHFFDILILAYFAWNILYLAIPWGETLVTRLYAFRAETFFVIVYWLGRWVTLTPKTSKAVVKILVGVGTLAGILVLFEFLVLPKDWPVRVGLMNYLQTFFNIQPMGHYGLTWTFETASGMRRYSGFFANPLELASSVLVTGITAFYVLNTSPKHSKSRQIAFITFGIITLSLLLAVSRASLIAYMFELIAAAYVLRKYYWIQLVVGFVIAGTIIIVLFSPDLRTFILQTITFQNPSSQGHLAGWMEGLNALLHSPLGLGFGTSGNVSARFGNIIGGENQYVIIGVQTGLVGLILYVMIAFFSIKYSLHAYYKTSGATKALTFIATFSKLGLLIPAFAAHIETYIFIMYVSWWLVGFSIQQLGHCNNDETAPSQALDAPNVDNFTFR